MFTFPVWLPEPKNRASGEKLIVHASTDMYHKRIICITCMSMLPKGGALKMFTFYHNITVTDKSFRYIPGPASILLSCFPTSKLQSLMWESKEEEAETVPELLISTETTPNWWPCTKKVLKEGGAAKSKTVLTRGKQARQKKTVLELRHSLIHASSPLAILPVI